MSSPAVTIIIVFFGIALLTAIRDGQWVRAAFWLAIGVAFLAMSRMRRARPTNGTGAGKIE